MIKYFCDRCGNEMSSYDYDRAVKVTIVAADDAEGMQIYTVCSNCEFAIKHFIKNNQFKAGDYK